MERIQFTRCTVVALLSTALIVPTASAQSGSRLCGLTATIPAATVVSGETFVFGGKIGLLYEARTKDDDIGKQCKDRTAAFEQTIQADPALKKLTWTRIQKAACDYVGQDFVSSADKNQDVDMCGFTISKTPYLVIKPYAAANKTVGVTRYSQL